MNLLSRIYVDFYISFFLLYKLYITFIDKISQKIIKHMTRPARTIIYLLKKKEEKLILLAPFLGKNVIK